MSKIVPVILCGGSGTRLWPRSRKDRPKPFLPLVGEETLFEATLSRSADPAQFAPALIVTGRAHLPLVEEQSDSHRGTSIIVEPEARNTAAAIALAAARLDPKTVMLVCPSDHHIGDTDAFRQAASKAADLAREGWLVAFGIEATSPETGYGYILRGESLEEGGHRVARFVEKPDEERARQFLADGGYSWNGGIFAFQAGRLMEELALHRPAIAAAARTSVERGRQEGMCFHPDKASFAEIEGESIDYAVMENTDRAAMVGAAMRWSDIGNWQALRDARQGDGSGNRAPGNAELVGCEGVLVESDGPRVSAIGLKDVAIVVNGDEVLVTSMDGAQRVGNLDGAKNQ